MHRRARRLFAMALVLVGAPAHAISTTATPKFHGVLRLERAEGALNRITGDATVRVRHWGLILTPDSNGIFPDQEPLVIAIGDDTFRLEAGMVKRNQHNHRIFAYRAARHDKLATVRWLRLRLMKDGSYDVSFTLKGVQLYQLNTEDPVCLPVAFIVGDDDGFKGVNFTSPTFHSKRLILPSVACSPDAWPWA